MQIPEELFNKMRTAVWGTFENVRVEIFSSMMENDYDQPTSKRLMQQAYATYARPLPPAEGE